MQNQSINSENSSRKLAHYFEYSSAGIEVIQDGLTEISFGEFLVEEKAVTRAQLFDALQLQDKSPGKRIGECLSILGHLPYADVQRFLEKWNNLDVVLV